MTEDLARHTRAAAQAIAGNEAPDDWLLNAVQQVVDTLLVGLVRYEETLPKLVMVRRRIEAVQAAARLIVDEFYVSAQGVPLTSDPKQFPIRDYLLSTREHSNELDVDLFRNLQLLMQKCDEGLNLMPAKAGRSRPLSADVADNTASGGIMCALAVSLLWRHLHNRLPAIDSDQAWRACIELWRAAGGGRLRGEGSGWRKDLQDARQKRYRREDAFLAGMLGVKEIHP